MRLTLSSSGICAAAAVCLSAGAAGATPINYGNFAALDATFVNVTENSITDATPLYNAPTVAGNTLDFNPLGFGSTVSGGAADVTDGLLTFQIDADPGLGILSLLATEAGDYSLGGLGTAATKAEVGQTFFVTVLEVDFVPLVTPLTIIGTTTFTPSAGSFFLPAEAGTAIPWTGSATINIAAALVANGIPGMATLVDVSSNNVLTTTSEANSVSLMQKKDMKFAVTTAAVPEPGMVSLLALAAGAVLARRRRR